jgi:hypothetical protein
MGTAAIMSASSCPRVLAGGHEAGVNFLLLILRQAGADEQAAALEDRLPAAGMFELFLHEQNGLTDLFRFGRDSDCTRPRHGAGKTWTYGLFLAGRDKRHGAALSGVPTHRNGRLNPNNPPPSDSVNQPTPGSSHRHRQSIGRTDRLSWFSGFDADPPYLIPATAGLCDGHLLLAETGPRCTRSWRWIARS